MKNRTRVTGPGGLGALVVAALLFAPVAALRGDSEPDARADFERMLWAERQT